MRNLTVAAAQMEPVNRSDSRSAEMGRLITGTKGCVTPEEAKRIDPALARQD